MEGSKEGEEGKVVMGSKTDAKEGNIKGNGKRSHRWGGTDEKQVTVKGKEKNTKNGEREENGE